MQAGVQLKACLSQSVWRTANSEQPVPEAGQMSCRYENNSEHGRRCYTTKESFGSFCSRTSL
jgi:hypothetical protein